MDNIRVVKGDLFESDAQTLVNTVNCVGVMGKGIALQFKRRFPVMFDDYAQRCKSGSVQLGEPYLWNPAVPPWVLNFPTKDHWRSVTRIDDILSGIDHIAENYRSWGIESLAVPSLGCGEGRLEWSVVGPTLYRELGRLDIAVELYAPLDASTTELPLSPVAARQPDDSVQRLDSWEVALSAVLHEIEGEPYRWPIGRISFHMIAYFATAAGIPTSLAYTRGSSGPFAEDFAKTQTRLLDNGVIREKHRGRMIEVRTGPAYEDAAVYFREDLRRWWPIIERVADLLLRTNTTQAEILASAHYATSGLEHRPESATERDVVDEVLRWKIPRTPPLEEQDIAEAIRMLNILGWTQTAPSEDLKREPDFAELIG